MTERWQRFSEKREAIEQEQQRLQTLWVRPAVRPPTTGERHGETHQ